MHSRSNFYVSFYNTDIGEHANIMSNNYSNAIEADSDIVVDAVGMIVSMVDTEGCSPVKALNKVARMLDLNPDESVGIGPAPELEVVIKEIERLYGDDIFDHGPDFSAAEDYSTPWREAMADELDAMDYEYGEY